MKPPQNTNPPRLQQIANVVRDDDDVVELRADHRAEQRGEQHVAHRRRFDVASAPRELALGDDLRDEKRQQHRDAEPGERRIRRCRT